MKIKTTVAPSRPRYRFAWSLGGLGIAALLAFVLWPQAEAPEVKPSKPAQPALESVKPEPETTAGATQTQAPTPDSEAPEAPDYPQEMKHTGESKEAEVLKVYQPKRELIKHPQFGLVIRLTYDTGEVRYEPPRADDDESQAIVVNEN